jgi:hypothetical protein
MSMKARAACSFALAISGCGRAAELPPLRRCPPVPGPALLTFLRRDLVHALLLARSR